MKKNFFFCKFYSGHVYRNLRTMPKVSAENPKRFKTFKNYFNQQIVPLVTQKLVLTTFWRFFAESLKKFSLKIRKKNSEKKNQKTVSSANFTLDTYIETWEPFQRLLQKIQNDLKLLKYILSHKLFLWTRRR